jgi:hypothetical protein
VGSDVKRRLYRDGRLTDVALWILRRRKLRTLLFKLSLELIEFGVRKDRSPLQVCLHCREVLGLLTIHLHHGRAIPSKVLFQEIKIRVVEELPSTDIVGLHKTRAMLEINILLQLHTENQSSPNAHLKSVEENPLLLLQRQAHRRSRVLVNNAIFVVGDAIIGVDVGLKEPTGGRIVPDLLACASDHGAILGPIAPFGEQRTYRRRTAEGIQSPSGKRGSERIGFGDEACNCHCEAGCSHHGGRMTRKVVILQAGGTRASRLKGYEMRFYDVQ